MSLQPFAEAPIMGLLASAGVAGFALAGSTGTIRSWQAPADGNSHRVILIASLHVTSAETGGQVIFAVTLPDGTTDNKQMFGAGQSAGVYTPLDFSCPQMQIIEPGSTVAITQNSALTAGAAVLFAELWGS